MVGAICSTILQVYPTIGFTIQAMVQEGLHPANGIKAGR
jgi:hypothetical protein